MFHWEIKDKVESLKREGKYDEAIKLVTDCISFTEQRACSDGRTLYAWPYEQAAILFRKLKKYENEIEVLERFITKQSAFDNQFVRLSDRLGKAYLLTRQAEKHTVSGVEELYHSNDQVPVHSREKFKRRGLVVDVETTGLSATDELIEFGAVLFLYSQFSGQILQIEDTYTALREPNVSISKDAAAIHGLTWADVKGCQLDEQRIRHLFSAADIVIAHNAPFDRRFIAQLYPDIVKKNWYCSMDGVGWKQKGHGSKGLRELARDCNLVSGQPHRGLEDAMTVVSLLRLIDGQSQRPMLLELLSSGPIQSSSFELKVSDSQQPTRIEVVVEFPPSQPREVPQQKPDEPIEKPRRSFWGRLFGR
jgi:DNA polymerase III subunit epsilon